MVPFGSAAVGAGPGVYLCGAAGAAAAPQRGDSHVRVPRRPSAFYARPAWQPAEACRAAGHTKILAAPTSFSRLVSRSRMQVLDFMSPCIARSMKCIYRSRFMSKSGGFGSGGAGSFRNWY